MFKFFKRKKKAVVENPAVKSRIYAHEIIDDLKEALSGKHYLESLPEIFRNIKVGDSVILNYFNIGAPGKFIGWCGTGNLETYIPSAGEKPIYASIEKIVVDTSLLHECLEREITRGNITNGTLFKREDYVLSIIKEKTYVAAYFKIHNAKFNQSWSLPIECFLPLGTQAAEMSIECLRLKKQAREEAKKLEAFQKRFDTFKEELRTLKV